MELLQWFVWLVYPYTVAAVLGMGIVWQYDTRDQFDNMQRKSGMILNRIVKMLWLLTTLTGIGLIVFNGATGELAAMAGWMIGFLHFSPDMEILKHASLLLQIHVILLFTFLLFFSFTKYVSIVFKPIRLLKTFSFWKEKQSSHASWRRV
ncbi:respiratory nitrate reductase subunit gamma [Neobacillus sp. YIM B06451]|uniref:respiratory nitrate reductase subunit gamma n=1 Tax=Neobacillus sp. YIM B06451 TaxID=3070994 RepID=UPI00292EA21C|nr:respiratory nitrate reductase subunit gamma [Neobacillus sp. YIM B06451]